MSHSGQLQQYWEGIMKRLLDQEEEKWLQAKVKGLHERGQHLKRSTFHIQPYHRFAYEDRTFYRYMLTIHFLVKDKRHVYLEEGKYKGSVSFRGHELWEQSLETETPVQSNRHFPADFVEKEADAGQRFTYDRREAVRYAERWWDNYNPAYRHFDVDCTNYVSQCLRAGGAPMWGQPNRSKGWWYSGSRWSYSWAVAHALRWYLSGARQGLTAKEVSSADQLLPGDVICYDFQGNGRFDHNTIVVKKNSDGMPLVNAHTSNSRHRYWAYEDSTAYTPDIQYKFFRIGE